MHLISVLRKAMYCSGSSHSSCPTLLIPAAAVVRHSQLSTRDTTILDTDIGLSNNGKFVLKIFAKKIPKK